MERDAHAEYLALKTGLWSLRFALAGSVSASRTANGRPVACTTTIMVDTGPGLDETDLCSCVYIADQCNEMIRFRITTLVQLPVC